MKEKNCEKKFGKILWKKPGKIANNFQAVFLVHINGKNYALMNI